MTPPVLTEGALGAVPALPVAAAPMVTDPALAAEFAALLGAAVPEGIGTGLPAPTTQTGFAVVNLAETPPGPAPNIVPEISKEIVGREEETEAARSSDPNKILDSAPASDESSVAADSLAFSPDPSLTPSSFALAAAVTQRTTLVAGGRTDLLARSSTDCLTVPRTPGKGLSGESVALMPAHDPEVGDSPDFSVLPEFRVEGEVSAEPVGDSSIPEAHLADVTAISGGGAQFESGERERESESRGEGIGEVALGEATTLVTDSFEGFEVTRTERLEARPLDRTERTRIVHEVIDRVTKHVETLAVTRSKDPLTIQLEPADLGRVVVEVSREASGLVAEMSATDPRVAEALDKHRSELAAGLAARGHAEARVTVQQTASTDNPAFDLRRDGNQTSQQQQQQHQSPRQSFAPNATASFARPSDRPRTRVRAAGLDLEI